MGRRITTIFLLTIFTLVVIYFIYAIILLKVMISLIKETNEIEPRFDGNEEIFLKGQTGYHSQFKENWQLINCLIWHESRGNENAVGKAGEIGVLQFMPFTFQEFCVNKYGYRNDIWSSEIQKGCCAEMIKNGYLHHWSTSEFCIN